MALYAENTVVVTPIPSVSVSTETMVNPGFFIRIRAPYFTSARIVSICGSARPSRWVS